MVALNGQAQGPAPTKNNKMYSEKKKHSRGVALLMVLATLSVLSAVVVEFAYHSNVTYNLALNDLDRTQAYYLAQSGLSFSKLVLKFDKEVQKIAKDAHGKTGKDVMVPALYEMIPIDTALFRAASGLSAAQEEEGPPQEDLSEEGGGEAAGGLGLIDLSGAEEFLDFPGDFSVEISSEDSKLNLNAFYNMSPKQKSYDRLKSTLYHLLATPEFEGLFEDRYRGAKDLAQNIVDYIDKDDVYNEADGQERGREGGSAGDTSMKNGKFISVEELTLVPGMTDAVFQKLKNYVTAYGADEKVWVCRAEEPLVRALILAYTDNNPKMEPIRDDNEEMLSKATEVVLASCPNTANMSLELDRLLGVSGDTGDLADNSTNTNSRGSNTSGNPAAARNSTSQNFSELVKDSGVIYTVVGVGTVGESEVRLKTILDTSNSNPRQWKELYWRVE